MCDEWNTTTLGDEVDILTGFPFKSALYTTNEHDIRLLRGDNIIQSQLRWDDAKRWPTMQVGDVSSYLLQEGDIVVAMDRPWIEAGLKYSAISAHDLPCLLVQRVARLRAKPSLDQRFLRYVIGSSAFTNHIVGVQTGTAVPHISASQIKEFVFQAPSLPEQRTIASILGALDDKIDLNRRMNETLEAIARALFTSWFVDFDPVRAKMEGRQPFGMDAEVAALFPASLEMADRSKPRGWRYRRLSELAHLDKGVSYKGEYLTDDGIPMINLGCFTGGGKFTEEHLKYYNGGYKQSHIVHEGDIVLANTDITQKREVLGSPAIVPPRRDCNHYIFTHHVYALRFTRGHEQWRTFIYFALLQSAFRKRAMGFATGTTVLALPRDAILDYQFVCPPEPLMRVFVDRVEPMLALGNRNIEQAHTLGRIRDTLLPRLLSGELRVREVERELEAVQ